MLGIEDKIKEWLDSQGYPLEMRVAERFQQAGFSVLQSRYFNDPEENKQREIDVTAAVLKIGKRCLSSVIFMIECKKSADKPWLIFMPPEPTEQHILRSAHGTFAVSNKVREDLPETIRMQWGSVPSLHPGTRYGHGITQAFTKGVDVPYKAVMGALKAALWRSSTYESIEEYVFAIPLVVIDGKLYECSLDSAGRSELTEVESGTLVLRIKIGQLESPKVRIVTLKGHRSICP